MRIFHREIPLRKALSVLLGFLHVTLIFAPLYAVICNMTNDTLPRAAVLHNHLVGLLFFVPAAASWFAIRYLRHIFFYILASAAIVAVTIFLFGSPLLAVPTVLLCFLRLYNRITGETASALDRPVYPVLIAFAVPFLFSFFVERMDGVFQPLSLLFAATYFILCFVHHGIERINAYIDVNRTVQNMPARRVVRMTCALLCAVTLLIAAVILPVLLSHDTIYRFVPAPSTGEAVLPAPDPTLSPEISSGEEGELYMPPDQPNPVLTFIWQVLEYVLIAAVVGGALIGGFFAVLRLSRTFRRTFTDRGDLVESLADDRIEFIAARGERRRRWGLFDFSPNAVVRRRYRKAVLRAASTPPEGWMTPTEAEAHAGLSVEKAAPLHSAYEKARYSPEGCTREDVSKL